MWIDPAAAVTSDIPRADCNSAGVTSSANTGAEHKHATHSSDSRIG